MYPKPRDISATGLLERRTVERAEKSLKKKKGGGLEVKIKGGKTKGILSGKDERNVRQNHPGKE